MQNALVSVVIPNYNYARYVTKAIDSVFAQSYKNIEIIVIDNGSTDNSLEVLKQYGSRITVIAQKNNGQSDSRNKGVAAAKGEYVAFLDADDLWLPDKIQKQIALFSDPEVQLVFCGFTRVSADLQPISSTLPWKRGWLLEDFATDPAAVVLGGESTAIIKKAALDKAGPFDVELSIGTGWDMWRRISCFAKIDYVPESLMLYRQHGSNLSARMDVYEHDTLHKLNKLFQDPAASAVHHLKNKGYSKHFLSLSGGYFHAKKYGKAIQFGLKSIYHRPISLFYILALPLRSIFAKK